MRRPPYLPFLKGPPGLEPGLTPLDPERWLIPDTEAAHWLGEKRTLMRERRSEVFADRGIPRALEETAALVAAEAGPLDTGWPSLLEAAAASVSDDLCLLMRDGAGRWCLEAASLCAPTFWQLRDRLGLPLGGLHDPVPGAAGRLVPRIARMFDALRPGQVLERFNWTVQAGAARFTPDSTPLKALAAATPPSAGALDLLHLRVERQTLRKLPETGAMLFTIRVAIDPLRAALAGPDHVAAFAAAWTGIDPAMAAYKGWAPYDPLVRAALKALGWTPGPEGHR